MVSFLTTGQLHSQSHLCTAEKCGYSSSSNKIVDYLSIAKDEVKKENDVADAAVPGSMFPEVIMNAIQMYMW